MLCGGLVTCPTCRTDQGITSADKLATEYSILAIIAAQQCSKSEMCPQHEVKLAFWCRTCHEPACGECLFEDHPIHVHDVVKSKDHISQLKDLATRRTDSALEIMNGFETKYLYGIFAAFAAMCESLKKVMMLHHDMEEGRHILTGILDADGISAAAAMADSSKGLSDKWGSKENESMASKNNRMNIKNNNKNNNNNNNNKVNGNNNNMSNNNAATNTLKKKKKRRQTSDFPDLVEESTPADPSDTKGEPVSVAAAAAAVVAAAAAAAADESAAAAAAAAAEVAEAAEKASSTGTTKAEEPRSSTPPPKPHRVNGAVNAPDFANSRYSIRKTKTLSDLHANVMPLPKPAPGQTLNSKSRRGGSNEASRGPSRSPTPERKPVKTHNKATTEKTSSAPQPSPEPQPPLPPPPPPKPETKDASTNTEEEREPTPPPASPTPPPAAASVDDALIPQPCPESVAIAIAQMEQRLISESTDGQLAKIAWEPTGMHVYCHQWQEIAYDLCIKGPLLRSLIPSKNPRVFLDINADDRRLGRVYITLWGHMRRAQNFMILCLGDMGPSYRGAKFFNVYNRGDAGERLVCGDYEYNNGRGGASVITDLEKSVEQLYPMDEGILVAGSIGRSSMDSMFVICTKGDPSRTVACPFGMVTSGLRVLQEAAQHYAYAEIWINDCGVLLWESPLQPIEND